MDSLRSLASRTSLRCAGLATLLYLGFIGRSAFWVDGEVYFTLFDDAMISMRYARHLATGHGLVWNIGEMPVEGYTNLLWTLWMAAIHWVGVADSWTALVVMLTGVVVLLALAQAAGTLANQLSNGSVAVTRASWWMVALYYPLIFWTLRGMEAGLVTLLVTVALTQAIDLERRPTLRRLVALACLLGVMVVTRRDAAVLHVVISLYAVWKTRRTAPVVAPLLLIGSLCVATGGQLLFSFWYYGDPLPNTYYLKLHGTSLFDRLVRGVGSLAVVMLRHLYVLVVPAALGAWVMWRGQRRRARLLMVLAALTLQASYMVYVGGDAWVWMGYTNRYLLLAVPPIVVLAMAGLWWAAEVRAHPTAFMRVVHVLLAVTLVRVGTDLALTSLGRGVDPYTATLLSNHGALALGIVASVLLLMLVVLRKVDSVTRQTDKRSIRFASLAIAVWILLNGQAVGQWVVGGGFAVAEDELTARMGLAIAQTSSDDALVAVTRAGNSPYFSKRPSIDILGKSDPVVAKGAPVFRFVPGHDKWNLDHSIGRHRPDLVCAVLSRPSDLTNYLDAAGYLPLPQSCFVRSDTMRLKQDALAEKLAALPH